MLKSILLGMKIREFMYLNLFEKAEIAWGGVFIADRKDRNDIVQLYLLGNFFVEVYFNFIDKEIITVVPFTSSKLLEPYYTDIDISSLFTLNS